MNPVVEFWLIALQPKKMTPRTLVAKKTLAAYWLDNLFITQNTPRLAAGMNAAGGRGSGKREFSRGGEQPEVCSEGVENREVLKINPRSPNTPSACCGDMDERGFIIKPKFHFCTLIF